MIAPATPTERLLLTAFRKLPVRDQIRILRQAKAAAMNARQPTRSRSGNVD